MGYEIIPRIKSVKNPNKTKNENFKILNLLYDIL
jgi:hypothetical protein